MAITLLYKHKNSSIETISFYDLLVILIELRNENEI